MGKIGPMISGFIAAFLAGIIFLIAGITDVPFLFQNYMTMVQTYFTGLDPLAQVALANTINMLVLIADYVGLVSFIAAFLILKGKGKPANLILTISVGVGLFGFAVPVFAALFQGGDALTIAVNGLATKYVVAILLVLIAKGNAQNV